MPGGRAYGASRSPRAPAPRRHPGGASYSWCKSSTTSTAAPPPLGGASTVGRRGPVRTSVGGWRRGGRLRTDRTRGQRRDAADHIRALSEDVVVRLSLLLFVIIEATAQGLTAERVGDRRER